MNRTWAGALLLLVLNSIVASRLFLVEITNHFGSVEPFFYAIANGIKARWFDPGWWPYWNLGGPAENTYQPLMHAMVATVSAITGASAARAFHMVAAGFYVAGPVTLYALSLRFTRRIGTSLLIGLGYSLLSPAVVFIEPLSRDMGGWFGRRMFTTVVYGDGPYMAGLTLVPLAILLVDRALEEVSPVRLLLAALAIVAVPLTNIPATVSLAMALAAYALASDWRTWLRRWPAIVGLALSGYLLAARLLPPSGLMLMAANVQKMNPEGRFSMERAGWYLWFAAAIGILTFVLHRFRAPLFVRFAALFTLITSVIVLTDAWFGVTLIGQASRFHLVMEMAMMMLAGTLLGLIRLAKPLRLVAIALIAFGTVMGAIEMYEVTRKLNKPALAVSGRSEYKVAQWMSQHTDPATANGTRALLPGSAAFWFNYWSDVPQMVGCCDQNALLQATMTAKYVIGTPDGGEGRESENAIAWMQALGVRYLHVSADGSTEMYRDFHRPEIFEGLPERWRDAGDVIYEVPGIRSIAHVVKAEELVQQMPINGLDIEPLASYRKAVTDTSRSQATFSWSSSRTASIRTVMDPEEVLSVQVAHHPGWEASANGHPAGIAKDALGMMVVQPRCAGPCDVVLEYTGGMEARMLWGLMAVGWLAWAVFLIRR